MEILDKLKVKKECKKLLLTLENNNLKNSEFQQILTFAGQNDEYKEQLLFTTLQKLKEQRKSSFIFEMMEKFPDYRPRADAVIRTFNEPKQNCYLIEHDLAHDLKGNWQIVLNSTDVPTMLKLCLIIQQKGLYNLNYVKLEDRAVDVTKNASGLKDYEKKNIKNAFINYILQSDECEIKDEIVRDVLFCLDQTTFDDIQTIYEILPECVDLNEFASFCLKMDFVDEFLCAFKNDQINEKTEKLLIHYVNNSPSAIVVKNALNFFGESKLDIEQIENNMIKNKQGYALPILVKCSNADLKKLEDAVLDFGDIQNLYDFAKNSDRAKLDNIISKMILLHRDTAFQKKVDSVLQYDKEEKMIAELENLKFGKTKPVKQKNLQKNTNNYNF